MSYSCCQLGSSTDEILVAYPFASGLAKLVSVAFKKISEVRVEFSFKKYCLTDTFKGPEDDTV